MSSFQYLLCTTTLVFVGCLIFAVVFDIWKYQIPNTVSIVAILDFFLSALFLPVQTHWISHLGAAVSVLVGGLILYRFRLLGAGDVKLMTAFSLWAGFESLPTFLLFMALAGGALSLVLVCLRYLVSVAQFQNLLPVMPQSIPRLLCSRLLNGFLY